jgi:hypothetical protein
LGNEIALLVNEKKEVGSYEVSFDVLNYLVEGCHDKRKRIETDLKEIFKIDANSLYKK